MILSVRLLIGRHGSGEPVDMRVKLISDHARHLQVEAQPSGDNRVRIDATVEAHPHSISQQIEHDGLSAVEDAHGSGDVANGDMIGVGNISGSYSRSISFLGHVGTHAAVADNRSSNSKGG